SPDSPGRLENLKELVESMRDFETLGGFLEHIALVMDRDSNEAQDAVSIMTLHGAKGLEFDTVFLPGWEEGLFPSQRSMDDGGRAQQANRRSPGPLTIDGDLVARSVDDGSGSAFSPGQRVFHLKFGYGTVSNVEGNKLSIDFEKAGRKKVLDSFVKKG